MFEEKYFVTNNVVNESDKTREMFCYKLHQWECDICRLQACEDNDQIPLCPSAGRHQSSLSVLGQQLSVQKSESLSLQNCAKQKNKSINTTCNF